MGRTFGTRRNVVVLVSAFSLVTHSLVSNRYSSMIAYLPGVSSEQKQMDEMIMAAATKHPNTEIISLSSSTPPADSSSSAIAKGKLMETPFVVSSSSSSTAEKSAPVEHPAPQRDLEEPQAKMNEMVSAGSSSAYLPLEIKLRESELHAPYLPLEVLKQYQKWHSTESLEKFPHNRTFTVGVYSCPLEAGNRLHHFFNGFLWAVVTNRTFLWKYFDKEECKNKNRIFHSATKTRCKAINRVEDCDQVLRRAHWLPSYDEWAPKLSLGEPERLHYWSTRPPEGLARGLKKPLPWKPEYVKEVGVDARSDLPLVLFPVMLTMDDDFLATEKSRAYLLRTDAARATATKLHSLGVEFMYGMFFRHLFTMVEESLKNIRQQPIDPSVFSVGLHSRHQKTSYNEGDIQGEVECLADLLGDKKRLNRTCEVYIMSDRELTVSRLQQYVETKNCTARVFSHAAGAAGLRTEHGPWNGLGFFQDLAFVSRARAGFVYTGGASSSSLVIELITYDLQMEAWRREGRNVSLALKKCAFSHSHTEIEGKKKKKKKKI
jgi:hypothetical protein